MRAAASILVGLFAAAIARGEVQGVLGEYESKIQPLLGKYCTKCHGEEATEAGIDLRGARTPRQILRDRRVWMEVLEQLDVEDMPPPKEKLKPTEAEYALLIDWIERAVENVDWKAFHDPGRVSLARLTTIEYRNSIRDIFGVDLQGGSYLGSDPEGNTGFTNDRDALTFPLFAFDNFMREAERAVDAWLGFGEKPWSKVIEVEEAWAAGSDKSVELDASGNGIVLKEVNSPFHYNVEVPFAGMYRVEFEASTFNGEPLSGVRVVVDGVTAERIVIEGTKPSVYGVTVNLAEGSHTVSFGYDPRWAPVLRPQFEPRTVPKHVARRILNDPIGKFPLPDKFRDDKAAAKTWSQLNKLIRAYVLTERLAAMLLEEDLVDYERHALQDDPKTGTFGSARTVSSFEPSKTPFNLTAGKVAVYLGIPQKRLEAQLKSELGFSHSDYAKTVRTYKARLREKYPERVRKVPGRVMIDRSAIRSHARADRDEDPVRLNVEAKDESGARRILQALGMRAYGRPPTAEELASLLRVYRGTRADTNSHREALRDSLVALLVSPPFLLRYAEDRGEALAMVDEVELARRYSQFLWLSIPDAELREAAAGGALREPGAVRATIDRMLASPKFDVMAEAFVGQWLNLDVLAGAENNNRLGAHVVQAMTQEPVLLFAHVFRENRSLLELVGARYTWLNSSLAHHYGVKGVEGHEMRRVALPDDQRGGLLAMGGMLTATSTPERTSPVMRGAWIVELMLGVELPPPPPSVPELKINNKARTVREELELHRSVPECSGCHSKIDPFGFVLENYDQFGVWRDLEKGKPVNARTKLADGSTINGVQEFKAYLQQERRRDFLRNITERLMEFALGRDMRFSDEATIQGILERVEADGYKARTLLREIVTSEPFLMQNNTTTRR